jgi:hypothetical protein
MQLFDPNNPNEKKKIIAAGVLGVAAIVVLGYVFFGGSSTKTTSNRSVAGGPTPSPTRNARPPDTPTDDLSSYEPITYNGTVPAVSEANRNIFAYYEPTPTPLPEVKMPTPTPVPTPPLIASSLAPSNIYARTPADFSLQIMGDKFTSGLHVTIDGRDLPTRFISAQQLFTTVPSALVLNPGTRQVLVRSNDGQLYSNTLMLNVTPPPAPNYNYIGLIGKPRFNDTAVLQDKNNKDLLNVQRGDVVSGRFRVNSISEKEVVLLDTTLKIRHTISFSADTANNPQFRQQPVRTSDDEP